MSETQLRELEAQWRAAPEDAHAREAALTAFRAAREDAPIDLIKCSADWRPFIDFAAGWFRTPLGPDTGYSGAELDAIEWRKRMRFPPTAREWWRIAGKHPCCGPWGVRWDGRFVRPDDRGIARGSLCIALDDVCLAELDDQTGIRFVIHRTKLDEPDPEVFEDNPIADEKDYCVDQCRRTGGTIPRVIWQSMVALACMVEEPPPLFKDDVFSLRRDLFICYEPGDPDWGFFSVKRGIDWDKLIAHFELRACPHELYFNRVHYNGSTIALGILGLAVRGIGTMNDVVAHVEAQGGNAMGLGTTLDAWKTYREWPDPLASRADPDAKPIGYFEPRTGRRYA